MIKNNSTGLIHVSILIMFLYSSGCAITGKASYQPPVIPLVISIDTNGEISLEVEGEVSLPTPLGTFSAGVVLDPVEKFSVQNVLTIRVDDRSDYFYDLNGNDFDVKFDSGYYEKVRIQKIGANITLEVKRKEEYQSQWFDANNGTDVPNAPPQSVNFPNPIVDIKIYEDSSLGGIGKVRGIVLAGGQPVGNQYVYIQNAEKDVVGIWSAYLAGSNGYNPGQGNGAFETERDPGTYLLWLDQIKGNWGMIGKVDGWEQQVIPFEVYQGKITEVTINLSVLEVGLTSNGSAVTDGFLNLYIPSLDAAGNLALGEEVSYSRLDNSGYASLIAPAGDYLLQWFAPGQCQYFDVSIPIGQTIKMIFDINNPGECIN